MLQTKSIRTRTELIEHFDDIAGEYREAHGSARRLLDYRLSIIRRLLRSFASGRKALLEIGCGPATHLLELSAEAETLVGVDISARMIDMARANAQGVKARFHVGSAEDLHMIPERSCSIVLCVGALEHMMGQREVFSEVSRVLEPGGVFICLTHNGDYLWRTTIAPAMGLCTQHLSTDRSLKPRELADLARCAELELAHVEPWTFIPRGDMPRVWSLLLSVLDGLGRLGRFTRSHRLRGGLAFVAQKRD